MESNYTLCLPVDKIINSTKLNKDFIKKFLDDIMDIKINLEQITFNNNMYCINFDDINSYNKLKKMGQMRILGENIYVIEKKSFYNEKILKKKILEYCGKNFFLYKANLKYFPFSISTKCDKYGQEVKGQTYALLNYYNIRINKNLIKNYHSTDNNIQPMWEQWEKMLIREKELSNEYYVFYTSWRKDIKVFYDILTFIKHLLLNKPICLNNKIIRYFKNVDDYKIKTIDDLFDDLKGKGNWSIKNKFAWNDFNVIGYYCLSANLSLFGKNYNYKSKGELSIDFFYANKNSSDYNFLKDYLNYLEIDEKDKIKINKLVDDFSNKFGYNYGIMNQIFIKKNIVNKLIYISLPYGAPLNVNSQELLELILKNNFGQLQKLIENEIEKYNGEPFNFSDADISIKKEDYPSTLQARIIYNEEYFTDGESVLFFENNVPNIEYNCYYVKLYNEILEIFIKNCMNKNCKLSKIFENTEFYQCLLANQKNFCNII